MRPRGPHAHSTDGRGYLQPLVYCSQHPISWQGTIPGAPTAVSPGRGVHSTRLGPPQCLRAAGSGLRTCWPGPLFWTQWRGKGCRGPKFLQLPPDRWTELDK